MTTTPTTTADTTVPQPTTFGFIAPTGSASAASPVSPTASTSPITPEIPALVPTTAPAPAVPAAVPSVPAASTTETPVPPAPTVTVVPEAAKPTPTPPSVGTPGSASPAAFTVSPSTTTPPAPPTLAARDALEAAWEALREAEKEYVAAFKPAFSGQSIANAILRKFNDASAGYSSVNEYSALEKAKEKFDKLKKEHKDLVDRKQLYTSGPAPADALPEPTDKQISDAKAAMDGAQAAVESARTQFNTAIAGHGKKIDQDLDRAGVFLKYADETQQGRYRVLVEAKDQARHVYGTEEMAAAQARAAGTTPPPPSNRVPLDVAEKALSDYTRSALRDGFLKEASGVAVGQPGFDKLSGAEKVFRERLKALHVAAAAAEVLPSRFKDCKLSDALLKQLDEQQEKEKKFFAEIPDRSKAPLALKNLAAQIAQGRSIELKNGHQATLLKNGDVIEVYCDRKPDDIYYVTQELCKHCHGGVLAIPPDLRSANLAAIVAGRGLLSDMQIRGLDSYGGPVKGLFNDISNAQKVVDIFRTSGPTLGDRIKGVLVADTDAKSPLTNCLLNYLIANKEAPADGPGTPEKGKDLAECFKALADATDADSNRVDLLRKFVNAMNADNRALCSAALRDDDRIKDLFDGIARTPGTPFAVTAETTPVLGSVGGGTGATPPTPPAPAPTGGGAATPPTPPPTEAGAVLPPGTTATVPVVGAAPLPGLDVSKTTHGDGGVSPTKPSSDLPGWVPNPAAVTATDKGPLAPSLTTSSGSGSASASKLQPAPSSPQPTGAVAAATPSVLLHDFFGDSPPSNLQPPLIPTPASPPAAATIPSEAMLKDTATPTAAPEPPKEAQQTAPTRKPPLPPHEDDESDDLEASTSATGKQRLGMMPGGAIPVPVPPLFVQQPQPQPVTAPTAAPAPPLTAEEAAAKKKAEEAGDAKFQEGIKQLGPEELSSSAETPVQAADSPEARRLMGELTKSEASKELDGMHPPTDEPALMTTAQTPPPQPQAAAASSQVVTQELTKSEVVAKIDTPPKPSAASLTFAQPQPQPVTAPTVASAKQGLDHALKLTKDAGLYADLTLTQRGVDRETVATRPGEQPTTIAPTVAAAAPIAPAPQAQAGVKPGVKGLGDITKAALADLAALKSKYQQPPEPAAVKPAEKAESNKLDGIFRGLGFDPNSKQDIASTTPILKLSAIVKENEVKGAQPATLTATAVVTARPLDELLDRINQLPAAAPPAAPQQPGAPQLGTPIESPKGSGGHNQTGERLAAAAQPSGTGQPAAGEESKSTLMKPQPPTPPGVPPK
jgi:hypothetical protein